METLELCVRLVTRRLMARVCFLSSISSLLSISFGCPTSGKFSFDSSENSCVRQPGPADLAGWSAGSVHRLRLGSVGEGLRGCSFFHLEWQGGRFRRKLIGLTGRSIDKIRRKIAKVNPTMD